MDWVDYYFIFGLFWAAFGAAILLEYSTFLLIGNLIPLIIGILFLIIGTILMIDAISRKGPPEEENLP